MENLCQTSTELFYPINLNKPPTQLWFWAVDKSSSIPSLLYLGSQDGHILLFALEQQPESLHRSFELDLHTCAELTERPIYVRAMHALQARRALIVATRTSVLELTRTSLSDLSSEAHHIGTFEEAPAGGIVEGGMAWSADDERVVFLLAPPARFLLMTSDFTPLHEVQLGAADTQPEAALVTVGWGKIETQFAGTGAKQATRSISKGPSAAKPSPAAAPPGRARARFAFLAPSSSSSSSRIACAWRPALTVLPSTAAGGEREVRLLAIESESESSSAPAPTPAADGDVSASTGHRVLRLWSDSGRLFALAEPTSHLGGLLAWRPGYNMLLALYAQPEQDDLRCVAYEANGLKRNSVPDVSLLSALAFGSEQLSAAPMCVCAESLEFSADGQLLAALVRLGAPLDSRVLLVFTFTNYVWHVKLCLALRAATHPLLHVRWHAAPGAGALLHVLFQSACERLEQSSSSEAAGAASVAAAGDGDGEHKELSGSSFGFLALRVETAPALAGSTALVVDGRYVHATHLALGSVPPPLCHYSLDFAELLDTPAATCISASSSTSTSTPTLRVADFPLLAVNHVVLPSRACAAEPVAVLLVFANLHAALLSNERSAPALESVCASASACDCVELTPRSQQFPTALLESRGVRPFRFVRHYAPIVAEHSGLQAALPFANNFTWAINSDGDGDCELEFHCCVPSARGSCVCRAQYSHSERRWRLMQQCELDCALECWTADCRRVRAVRAHEERVAHVRDGRLLGVPSSAELQLSPSSSSSSSSSALPRTCSTVWLATVEAADGAAVDVSVALAAAHYTLYVGGQELAADCTCAALTADAQFLLYVRTDETLLAGMSTLCALRLRGLAPDAFAAVAQALRPSPSGGGKQQTGTGAPSLKDVLARYTYKRPCERGSRLLHLFERSRDDHVLPSTVLVMEMPRGNLEQCELPLFIVHRLIDLVADVQRRWCSREYSSAGVEEASASGDHKAPASGTAAAGRLLAAGGWADVFEQMVRARINATLLLDLFGYDCAPASSRSASASASASGAPASRDRSLLLSRVVAELVADLSGATESNRMQRTVLPHDLLTLFLLDLREENACESLYADLVGALHLSWLRRADCNDWCSLGSANASPPGAAREESRTKQSVVGGATATAAGEDSDAGPVHQQQQALSFELAAEQEGATWTREELEDARRLRVRLDARNQQAGACGAADAKSSKVNAICAEVRRAIQTLSANAASSSRHLIPLVSTFLREDPQRVVHAVVCIARESAREQQPLKPLSGKSDASPVDRAISHTLQLLQHDYSRLFDALLSSRDFDFLLRVGRRLQIDPNEYLPQLEELLELDARRKRCECAHEAECAAHYAALLEYRLAEQRRDKRATVDALLELCCLPEQRPTTSPEPEPPQFDAWAELLCVLRPAAQRTAGASAVLESAALVAHALESFLRRDSSSALPPNPQVSLKALELCSLFAEELFKHSRGYGAVLLVARVLRSLVLKAGKQRPGDRPLASFDRTRFWASVRVAVKAHQPLGDARWLLVIASLLEHTSRTSAVTNSDADANGPTSNSAAITARENDDEVSDLCAEAFANSGRLSDAGAVLEAAGDVRAALQQYVVNSSSAANYSAALELVVKRWTSHPSLLEQLKRAVSEEISLTLAHLQQMEREFALYMCRYLRVRAELFSARGQLRVEEILRQECERAGTGGADDERDGSDAASTVSGGASSIALSVARSRLSKTGSRLSTRTSATSSRKRASKRATWSLKAHSRYEYWALLERLHVSYASLLIDDESAFSSRVNAVAEAAYVLLDDGHCALRKLVEAVSASRLRLEQCARLVWPAEGLRSPLHTAALESLLANRPSAEMVGESSEQTAPYILLHPVEAPLPYLTAASPQSDSTSASPCATRPFLLLPVPDTQRCLSLLLKPGAADQPAGPVSTRHTRRCSFFAETFDFLLPSEDQAH